MHSTLLYENTASSGQNNSQIAVLGNRQASWSFNRKPSAVTALKRELSPLEPSGAWRPPGNVGTSKPVVVCLRKERPTERHSSSAPCHVQSTRKRPAIEHLKKADIPQWTTISLPSPVLTRDSASKVKNGVAWPYDTAAKKCAPPAIVRVKAISPKWSTPARSDTAKRCDTTNTVSGRTTVPDGKIIKIELKESSDAKPKPEQAERSLKLLYFGKPLDATERNLAPKKLQKFHESQSRSQSSVRSTEPKEPICEKAGTVLKERIPLKVKLEGPSAESSRKVLSPKASKDSPPRPRRAVRKRSLEGEDTPAVGAKRLKSSNMQVPQRRVSVDSCADECPMPLLEPLVEEKDVTTKKDEPNSPEMPMLLPVIVKSEEIPQSETINTRHGEQIFECGRVEGNAVVDTIDGVDFYSFSSEKDLEEFSREFEEASSMEECPWSQSLTADDPELLNSEVVDNQVLLPRKTNDITKIKGWRKKNFGADVPVSTPPHQDVMAVDKAEMSKGVRSAFVSDMLNDFLENKSALRVVHLAKLNPNITPPPDNCGVLSLRVPLFQEHVEEKETESKRQTRATAAVGRYSGLRPAMPCKREPKSGAPESPVTKPAEVQETPRPVRRVGRPPKIKPAPTPPPEVKVKTEPPDVEDTPFLAMTSRNLRPSTMNKSMPEPVAKPSSAPSPAKTPAAPMSTSPSKQSPNPKATPKPYGSEPDYDIIRDSFVTDAQEVLLKALLAWCRQYDVASRASDIEREPAFICPQLDSQDALFASEALLAYEVYSGKANAVQAQAKGRPPGGEATPVKAVPTVKTAVTSPAAPVSTSTPSVSPTASGSVQSTTRSRRPIRLPARFQDSALLLPSGGDLWDMSPPKSSGLRQRSSTKSTPPNAPTTASTPVTQSTIAQARPPAAVHQRLPNPHSVPTSQSPVHTSSSSSASSSSSESSAEDNSPLQSDVEEEGEGPRTRCKAVASLDSQELSGAEKDYSSNEIDIETISDLTDSTPTLLSDDDSNSQGKKSVSGHQDVEMALDALENAESLEWKATRERIRRRVMLQLFIDLQNTVFAAPSTRPKVAVLPKVAILTQAVKYLNGLKALSLHLDGEKRRLRQRHSLLEAQLKIAKRGGVVKLEPGPAPRAMPASVTAVCDIHSPILGPLCNVATEVLLATQRKRLGQDEPVSGSTSESSTPKPKKMKAHHPVAANGKKKLGRISVTTKKPGTLTSSKTAEQDKVVQQSVSYTVDGRSIGALRPLAPKTTPSCAPAMTAAPKTTPASASKTAATPKTTPSCTSTATVTPVPTNPGSPQKYTLYPARGTMLGDLSKVAAVAQHLIGPCVIKRVKLRTGQTVLIYRKSASDEGAEQGENDKGGIVLVPEQGDKILATPQGDGKGASSVPNLPADALRQEVSAKEGAGEKGDSKGVGSAASSVPDVAKTVRINRISADGHDGAERNSDEQKSRKQTTDSRSLGGRSAHGEARKNSDEQRNRKQTTDSRNLGGRSVRSNRTPDRHDEAKKNSDEQKSRKQTMDSRSPSGRSAHGHRPTDGTKKNSGRQKGGKQTTDSRNLAGGTAHSKHALARKTMGEVAHLTSVMSAQARAKGLVGPPRTSKGASQPFVRTVHRQVAVPNPSAPLQRSGTGPVPTKISAAKDSPFLPGSMWGIARTVPNAEGSSKREQTVVKHEEPDPDDADEEIGDMSEWVSGDGEMCIIRKLPLDSDEESDGDLPRDRAVSAATMSS